MRDCVQPFAVPGQHPCVDFKALQRLDLALEEAAHCTQRNHISSLDFNRGLRQASLVSCVESCEACANDGSHGVCSCNIQVGEVSRVGFVEIVVGVVRRVVGLGDEWGEEVFRRDRAFLEVDLVYYASQDT